MKIYSQRLRNLTTGLLHTDIGCVYEDLGMIMGQEGLMTHMLPRAMRAVEPWLKDNVIEGRFWDCRFDQTHIELVDLPEPTIEERKAMVVRYLAQPDPLDGKVVIGLQS